MSDFEDIIQRAASKYGVDADLLRKMVMAESAGNPKAVSPVGAQGLMQLMPNTASEMGVKDAFDPEQNIMGGSQYISQMLNKFGGDKRKALAAYNWGPSNVEGGKAFPSETTSYINKILGNPDDVQPPGPPQVPFEPVGLGSPAPRRVVAPASIAQVGSPTPQPAPPPGPMPPPGPPGGGWDRAMGMARTGWDAVKNGARTAATTVANEFGGPATAQAAPPPSPTVPPQVPRTMADAGWRRSIGAPSGPDNTDTVGDVQPRGPLGISSFATRPTPPPLPTPNVIPPKAMAPRPSPSAMDMLRQHMSSAPNPNDYKLSFGKKLLTGLAAGLVSANDPEAGLNLAKEANTGGYNRALQAYNTRGGQIGELAGLEERASSGAEERAIREREVAAHENYWKAMGGAATEKADKYQPGGARRTGALKALPVGQQSEAWQMAAERLYATNPKIRKYLRKIERPQGPIFVPASTNQESWIGRNFNENESVEQQNALQMVDNEARKFTNQMLDPWSRGGGQGQGVPPEIGGQP